jgi:hypothetical protein
LVAHVEIKKQRTLRYQLMEIFLGKGYHFHFVLVTFYLLL